MTEELANSQNAHEQDERSALLAKTGRRLSIYSLSPEDVTPYKRTLLVLCLLLSSYLTTLDLTIVATCLPTISSELHLSNQASWIGTSYLWSTVTFTPLYGRLADIIGRRNAFLQALFLFGLGTLLCGVAPDLPFLAVSRFIAGAGGGGIGTVASVIIADVFLPRDRPFYQSLLFMGFACGIGSGGPIGGSLTQTFGWHAVFSLQIPLIATCGLLAFFCLPGIHYSEVSVRRVLQRLDVLGSLSLLISIGSFLYALSLKANSRVANDHPLFIAAAVTFFVFFLVFVYVELRVAAEPVLPLELLTKRVALCVGIISGLVAVVNFTMIYLIPTFFEIVFDQSVSQAGAHLLPNAVAMAFGAPIVGLTMRKTGRYKWQIVFCCAGPLITMIAFSLMNETAKISQWITILPMGFGFSGLLTATIIALLANVEKSQYAVANGFVFVWRSLGQVFGVGVSQAIFQTALGAQLSERIDSPEIVERLRHSTESIKELSPELHRLAVQAFKVAIHQTFYFAAAGAAIVLLTALFIPNGKIENQALPVKQPEAEV